MILCFLKLFIARLSNLIPRIPADLLLRLVGGMQGIRGVRLSSRDLRSRAGGPSKHGSQKIRKFGIEMGPIHGAFCETPRWMGKRTSVKTKSQKNGPGSSGAALENEVFPLVVYLRRRSRTNIPARPARSELEGSGTTTVPVT